MPCPSSLYAHPPESSEGPELPLKALAEGFEVSLAEFGFLWVFVRVGQGHEDDLSSEVLEGTSVHPNRLSMRDWDRPARIILTVSARKRSMRQASVVCLADETNRP